MKYLPVLYARQLACILVEAYKLHDTTGKCQYVNMLTGCVAENRCQSSTMIFNKVASKEQKHELEKIADEARYMNYKDANDRAYGLLKVKAAEMQMAVLLAEVPEAKKDMMQYCKHFTTIEGDHLADAVKFYEEAGAPLLAQIVKDAIAAPSLSSEKPRGYMKAGSEGMW